MDEHTSAGLPTSSEMIQFINTQELRIAIEDHVSAKGITHKNLVVYFKPFHGKYYNWIRRYNGSENGWTRKVDNPGGHRIYLQIERRRTINNGGSCVPHKIYGIFKKGHKFTKTNSDSIDLKSEGGVNRSRSFVVFREYTGDYGIYFDQNSTVWILPSPKTSYRLRSRGCSFGQTVFLLRPMDAAKGYFVLRQDVEVFGNKDHETLLGLNLFYDKGASFMHLYYGMRIGMVLGPTGNTEIDGGGVEYAYSYSNIINRSGVVQPREY